MWERDISGKKLGKWDCVIAGVGSGGCGWANSSQREWEKEWVKGYFAYPSYPLPPRGKFLPKYRHMCMHTHTHTYTHTHTTGTYYSINFPTVFLFPISSPIPDSNETKCTAIRKKQKCWELGSVYVHKIVLETCLACAHGNNTLTHPTSIITLATSFWPSPQQQRPGTCVSKRKKIKINAVLIGLPWWLRWLRICVQCRRSGFDPWVRKIP